MEEVTPTLIGPFDQLLPMTSLPLGGHLSDENLPIITQAGILSLGSHIIEVGSFEALRKKADHIIELSTPSVALPGFIDSHTHICWAGSRAGDYAKRLNGLSYQEIAKSGGGILDTVQATRKATEEELVQAILSRCERLKQIGVTTCEVKSGYGLTVEDECKILRAIQKVNKKTQSVTLIPTCLAAHITPPEFDSPSSYLEHLQQELLPILKRENLTNRIDIFIEKGAFTPKEARPYLLAAKGMGFSLTLHADQFSRGGAMLAAEFEALSADHLECSKEEDALALAEAGVTPIVLPGASLGLGEPFANPHLFLNVGLPLVIASDWNPGSAPMGDLLTQAALFGANQKLSMATTLAAITTRAAHALDLNDRGQLHAGARADFSIFPTNDYREILYSQGRLCPKNLYIEGKEVL